MKKYLAIAFTLMTLQAHASDSAVNFVGQDSDGQPCSVTIDLEINHLAFWYIRNDGQKDGYGYTMTEDFKRALRNNESPITINQGGVGGATLKMWFNDDGTMDAKFRNFLVMGTRCENMQRQK